MQNPINAIQGIFVRQRMNATSKICRKVEPLMTMYPNIEVRLETKIMENLIGNTIGSSSNYTQINLCNTQGLLVEYKVWGIEQHKKEVLQDLKSYMFMVALDNEKELRKMFMFDQVNRIEK